MEQLLQLIGKNIDVEISGKSFYQGVLIDAGLDIIVIYQEQEFIYIPLVHVQHIEQSSLPEDLPEQPPDVPIHFQTDNISYRKVLDNAKGKFIEIYVTGNKSIHGYVTSIMNDYFVFYSPVYKTIFVSLDHVKWIIPSPPHLTPYSLANQHFPVNPTSIPLSRTFEQQCKRLEGNLVVFDLGDHPNKIGLLVKMESSMLKLVTANGKSRLLNLRHLKTFHLPGVS
jgi:hypothetical protein